MNKHHKQSKMAESGLLLMCASYGCTQQISAKNGVLFAFGLVFKKISIMKNYTDLCEKWCDEDKENIIHKQQSQQHCTCLQVKYIKYMFSHLHYPLCQSQNYLYKPTVFCFSF